jgi:hypothetical protein
MECRINQALSHVHWQRCTTTPTAKMKFQKSCTGEKRCWPDQWVRCLPQGGPEGHCWYPTDLVPPCISFNSRQRVRCSIVHRHISRSFGSCLPAEVGSGAALCPAAPEPAFLVRRALAPPHAPCVLWLQILPPCGEGFGLPRVLWPPVGRGPQARRKALQACLCGKACIFRTHAHMFPRRLTLGPLWAYKTCRQAPLPVPARRVDKRLQCGYDAAPALLTTRLSPLQCMMTR